MQRTLVFLLLFVWAAPAAFAQETSLTVAQIMQDPETWIGSPPSDPFWTDAGDALYFSWNPEGRFPSDSLYKVAPGEEQPVPVAPEERRSLAPRFTGWHHGEHRYDQGFTRRVYARDGDLFLYSLRTGDTRRLTQTLAREEDPRFSARGTAVVFEREDNLYRFDLRTGATTQLTDLRSGAAPAEEQPDAQDAFLEEQQQALFETLRKRKAEREAREAAEEREEEARGLPPTFYYGERNVQGLQLAPGGRYVTFTLYEQPAEEKETEVQDYVTESGYAETLEARPKVGNPMGTGELYVQDLVRDTTYRIDLHALPGAYDVPAYLQEQNAAAADSAEARRGLVVYGPFWSGDGRHAVVEVRALDHKDRWIARLDPETGALTTLDRQHDEAWVAGPGISWHASYGPGTVGWLPDDRRFYFQSERTGYSHLYTVDVATGAVEQLTEGTFEVFDPMLSQDGQTWTFTSSEGSPYERHFYRMPLEGGVRTRLTTLTGRNEVRLAPDERHMGLLHSYTNRPPELYLQTVEDGAAGEPPRQVTHSTTDAWEAYDWRDPEIITFEASDGVAVPAQLFRPERPNGAAVLFVHGAGYLQNVHRWWSSYFREYMFHNLLADLGYTVLNVDYRASEGYGRDWRTAIYRHMGGRDLQDYVDASRYLGRAFDIDPERVFIYGGSYGGFLSLMALFTEPEHFGGGAALRAVTDWAHYHTGYTAPILNLPETDSLAYARSSPIYFAEGLEDPLLIAHGMVDTNVHFQDVVRLAQRLIELGKEDWEMAVYPVEGHGFAEPESWTDEYRRVLELIQESVGP